MKKQMLVAIICVSPFSAFGQSSGEAGDATPIWARGPVIEAQGRAFIEVPANRSSFNVTFERNEAESADATAAVVDVATVATQAIRQAANDQVRINANLSVRPYYQQIERSREDNAGVIMVELIENVHPDALLGYVASVRINVTVLAPERTDAVRGAALAAGPTSAGAVRFSLEPTVENQRTAFSAALDDAHARARAAAELSGAQLGKLLLVQEGRGPCVGSPSTRVGRSAAIPPPPAPAAPAPVAGTSRATAVQEIVDAAERYALAADPNPQRVEARVCTVYAVR